MSRLVRRQTDLSHAERTPFKHKYLLKKPRTHEADPVDLGTGLESTGEEADIDNPAVEKRRFELFIDLIWVGIIGNVADHFKDKAYSIDTVSTVGQAVVEFIVLFLIAWRIWKFLQEYMSKYRTNDVIERTFVVWALILAMVYGNNAPYILESDNQSNLAITVYLVFKASLTLVETYYSIHLPHIRRRVMAQTALALPILGLWIPAYWFKPYPTKAAFLFAAVTLEYWTVSILETPLAEKFLNDDRKEIFNMDHWVERVQDFYIIILGEGVLSLIRGSPLGEGLTTQAAAGVGALWIYYSLSGFYFNGDASKRYIHAVRRVWWRRFLWLSLQISMFGNTLILGVTIAFLIEYPSTNAVKPPEDAPKDEHRLYLAMSSAKWVFSVCVAMILAEQTAIALLNRSLDAPKSLKVSNRYLRLLPRLVVIIVALCLPLDKKMVGILLLGTVSWVLIPCLIWEWYASVEYGGGVFEPLS